MKDGTIIYTEGRVDETGCASAPIEMDAESFQILIEYSNGSKVWRPYWNNEICMS